MISKDNKGGFKNIAIRCPHCGKTFRVEHLDEATTDDDVKHCPYCGEDLYPDDDQTIINKAIEDGSIEP